MGCAIVFLAPLAALSCSSGRSDGQPPSIGSIVDRAGSMTTVDEHEAILTILVGIESESPVDELSITIDGRPLYVGQKLVPGFTSGYIHLNPEPGEHTVTVTAGDEQKSLTVEVKSARQWLAIHYWGSPRTATYELKGPIEFFISSVPIASA